MIDEDEYEICCLFKDFYIVDKIINFIVLSIYGYIDIKIVVVLFFFGGVVKVIMGGYCVRGDINVLLFGDLGIVKF